MPDAERRCRSCGIRFLYTDFESRRAADLGLAPPDLCPGCRALDALTRRRAGRVKWYTPKKGFGFIAQEVGDEVFVHVADLDRVKRLRKGQRVTFRVAQTAKGVKAVDVRPT